MQNNNILRLAMILGGNQAQNFITNLKKIIKLVLFDNYSNPLKTSQISKAIFEQYFLEFEQAEIVKAIKHDEGIVIIEDDDPVNNKYSLTPNEYQKMESRQRYSIDDFIVHFLRENELPNSNFDEIKDLIYRYLYFTFNSDTKTVLELLNKDCNIEIENSISDEFSPEESEIINCFLNWDNKTKNEYILNMISACFDYCMLTIKKDSTSYSQIFNGKSFFLDSNIIFRLAGFNKEERKTVLDAFIKKCTGAGIKICYTNQTNEEIKNTISHYVDTLKNLLSSTKPISIKAMQVLSSKYSNLDFYEKYYDWCNVPKNRVGDFSSFKKYLEREVSKIISPFKQVVINTNYSRTKDFKGLVDDFTAYKNEHYRNTYEGAIKVDINNYLFMLDKNNDGQASNFLDLKYYFITADHSLTEWAKLQRVGTVPIFVLPSVWYSILLKYKGRTDEDYQSFCKFLNIRIAPERDPLLKQKQAMLAYILDLNEEQGIKEEIIFDIESRLKEDNMNIEDPITYAEMSHQSILSAKIDENTKKLETEYETKIDEVKRESEKKFENKIKELNSNHSEDISKTQKVAFSSGQNDILSKQAKETASRNKAIIGICNFIWAILLVIFVISVGYALLKDTRVAKYIPKCFHNFITMDMINWYEHHVEVCCLISGAMVFIFKLVKKGLNYFGILLTDEKEIKKNLAKKYNSMKLGVD